MAHRENKFVLNYTEILCAVFRLKNVKTDRYRVNIEKAAHLYLHLGHSALNVYVRRATLIPRKINPSKIARPKV